MSLKDKILADLMNAGFVESDEYGSSGISWTKTGRKKYGGEYPNHPDNYAADLAERISDIYGPLATVGTPKDFGTVEVKLLDLPEVLQMIEEARQKQEKAAPIFMTGIPLAAVFQTGDEDYYFTDGKVTIEGKSRARAFKQLAAAVKRENTGLEILSLYLADGSSNIIFDEPGKPNEEHSMHGTILRLISWISERVHNDTIRRQLASKLLITGAFTFDDLQFAVYKSEDGFYFWNGTDESTRFDSAEDASAAMLDFLYNKEDSPEGYFKITDLAFGVLKTESGDFDIYMPDEDGEIEYLDSTAELANAAETLANHLYNEYKATPFGKLADKVVVMTRQTNGDFMAALEGHDGAIGGAFRHVAAEVLKVIAGLADDDQKAQFAGIFDDRTIKVKRLITGILATENDKYLVKTGADDYRRFDNLADAEADYKAHFMSDKLLEAALKSVMAAPPVKQFDPLGPLELKDFNGVREVHYMYGNKLDRSVFVGVVNGQDQTGPLNSFDAALSAVYKFWSGLGHRIAPEAEPGDLLLLGLYQKPASGGGYYMTGAVPAVQFETRNSDQVMVMMKMYLENWYKNEAHYPDPHGRVTPPASEPEARQVFGLYRWPDDKDGAYYSFRVNGGVSIMGNMPTVRPKIYDAIAAEGGVKIMPPVDTIQQSDEEYLVAGLFRTKKGYRFRGSSAVQADSIMLTEVLTKMDEWVHEFELFRKTKVVGADPASQRPDDMVIAFKQAYPGLYFGGHVQPFNDPLDNMAAGFSALTRLTTPEAREVLKMIVEFANSGPLTFERLKYVFNWLNTPTEATRPIYGVKPNFGDGPFVAEVRTPAEEKQRQEYAGPVSYGTDGKPDRPAGTSAANLDYLGSLRDDPITDPEESAEETDPDPEKYRDLDSSCGE